MTRDDVIRMANEAGYDEWEIGVEGKARSALMSRRLAKLERFAELVAARYKDDAERLDWIEKKTQPEIRIAAHYKGFSGYCFRLDNYSIGFSGSLREAIDAARAKEQTP